MSFNWDTVEIHMQQNKDSPGPYIINILDLCYSKPFLSGKDPFSSMYTRWTVAVGWNHCESLTPVNWTFHRGNCPFHPRYWPYHLEELSLSTGKLSLSPGKLFLLPVETIPITSGELLLSPGKLSPSPGKKNPITEGNSPYNSKKLSLPRGNCPYHPINNSLYLKYKYVWNGILHSLINSSIAS